MRRRPNPWIAVPSLALGILGGGLGWMVTDVACRQPDADGIVNPCYGWAAVVATLGFLGVTIGVTVLLALVYRSIAEWREGSGRSGP